MLWNALTKLTIFNFRRLSTENFNIKSKEKKNISYCNESNQRKARISVRPPLCPIYHGIQLPFWCDYSKYAASVIVCGFAACCYRHGRRVMLHWGALITSQQRPASCIMRGVCSFCTESVLHEPTFDYVSLPPPLSLFRVWPISFAVGCSFLKFIEQAL